MFNNTEFWLVFVRLFLTCVLVAVVFIAVKLFFKGHDSEANKLNYLKSLPGPPPNIFFGNMLDFMGSSADFLDILNRYFKTYGKTILIHDGPLSNLVGTMDSKFLEFLMSSTKIIDKSDNYLFFHSWLGTGLLTSAGSKWKRRRRMLTPAFHFSILENFVEVFNSVGNVLINKLDSFVGEENVNIYPLVTLFTLDVICEAAMGIKINAQNNENSEYVRSVKVMCEIITSRNFSPLHPRFYGFTWNYLKEKKVLKVLHNHTDSVIEKRLAQSEQKSKYVDDDGVLRKAKVAFLDLLIQTTVSGEPLSRIDIREEVDTFMFEGHDTTASALSFALYLLATNPLVQQKAFEEQKTIFEDLNLSKITIADLHKMKYLELVIKETLRLYPSVPFFGRKSQEDIEYDGTWYPKGTNFVMFIFNAHRNPDYFSDPEKFIPERFLDFDGKNPYIYTPFSAGSRNCIGQKFAMLEMKCTLSKVLRNFELLPADPAHNLLLAPEIILVSKNGIKIRIKRRSY